MISRGTQSKITSLTFDRHMSFCFWRNCDRQAVSRLSHVEEADKELIDMPVLCVTAETRGFFGVKPVREEARICLLAWTSTVSVCFGEEKCSVSRFSFCQSNTQAFYNGDIQTASSEWKHFYEAGYLEHYLLYSSWTKKQQRALSGITMKRLNIWFSFL